MHCRAAKATQDAQTALKDVEKSLSDSSNWGESSSTSWWNKVVGKLTGRQPTLAERAQQAAKDAYIETQKRADDAVARAKQVRLCLGIPGASNWR